jgi:hypothetical protein
VVVSLFVESLVAVRADCAASRPERLAPDHLRYKDDKHRNHYNDQPRHRSVRRLVTPPAYHHISSDHCGDHT